MNSRLFAIVMFSLFFGLTSTAQEIESDEETLFELSYNNYGPCVRLYKKDGKIMKAVEGSGIRDKRINKFLYPAGVKGDKPTMVLYIDDYDQIVGDSIIDQLYPRLKEDVKKKKKEDKKWAKELKKRYKNYKGPIEMENGGTLVTLTINMKGIKYKTSVYEPDKDDHYAFWFWDEMLDVCRVIMNVRGEFPQSIVDELSNNGEYELIYNYREMRFPQIFYERQ